jgi:hypothetical protein
MNQTPFTKDSEIRLIQKLNDLEIGLYKVRNSLVQWGICLVLILTGTEAYIFKLLH